MDQSIKSQKPQYIDRFVFFILSAVFAIMFHQTDCKSQTSDGYETEEILNAYNLFPPEMLKGDNFTVFGSVINSGFTNYYTIATPYGQFEAEGDYMLQVRIQEIKAITVLREVKKTKAFAKAAKQAAKSSVEGAVSLITHPVKTVTGIRKGMRKLFSRMKETREGGGEVGEYEDSRAKQLIGFAKLKRQYASELGVNVYSSNEVLQKKLNSVTWAAFAGDMGMKLLTVPMSGTVKIVTKLAHYTDTLNDLILDKSPKDLRLINRERLEQIGVEESAIEEFLKHPSYSPRHMTFLVYALVEMKGVKNRPLLIKQSLKAESEEQALCFQLLAQLMLGYHKHVEPINEILPWRRLVIGYTANKHIVSTLPLDYMQWTKLTALGLTDAIQLGNNRPVDQWELWITGRLSPRARLKLKESGVTIKEQIGEKLMPKT